MKASQPLYGEPLSFRELGVLRLLRYGKTNQQIAADLALSEDTVKSHLHRMYIKLGVRDRTGAVVAGMEMALLPCRCGQSVAS